MSDYTPVNDFSAKDALTTGDPEKTILGSDVDAETAAIQTAIATKYDSSDLASQAEAEAETSNVVLLTPLRLANWADANGGMVGDIQALTDPAADRLLGWDDSAGAVIGFTVSGAAAFSGTALTVSAANILTQLLTVDGTGSTLDADTVDGSHASAFAAASHTHVASTDLTGQVPVANGGTAAATAADARTNLGLGTIATQAASAVTISGGSITGITDIAVADGGTGASTAAGARTNLGVTATGGDTTYAFRSNNLSDLGSASSARTNLGLGGLSTVALTVSTSAASGTPANNDIWIKYTA